MDDLTTRCAWAIAIIPADRDLDKGITDVSLAKVLGTDKNTLARYRNGKGLLKGEVIDNLVKRYNFSPQWIFKGTGEPFPGAREKYPEVCGPEPEPDPGPAPPQTFREGSGAYKPAETGQSFSIDEDLMLAASVLASKSHYATALHLNIRSFSGAIASEREMSRCKEDLRKQGEQIQELQSNIKQLKEEIKELRGLDGGFPPIALGLEDAAPTGSED